MQLADILAVIMRIQATSPLPFDLRGLDKSRVPVTSTSSLRQRGQQRDVRGVELPSDDDDEVEDTNVDR